MWGELAGHNKSSFSVLKAGHPVCILIYCFIWSWTYKLCLFVCACGFPFLCGFLLQLPVVVCVNCVHPCTAHIICIYITAYGFFLYFLLRLYMSCLPLC